MLDTQPSAAGTATRRLIRFAVVMLLGYSAVGLPLSTVPIYAHEALHAGPGLVGFIVGLAPVVTLVCRPIGGWLSGRFGARPCLLAGLIVTASSGICYAAAPLMPADRALAMLLAGRLLLGVGDGVFTTALNLWMVASAGPAHAGRAMAWAGIAMYGAMAAGAPLGAVLYTGGMIPVAIATVLLPLLGMPVALRLAASPVSTVRQAGLLRVIGRMWIPGAGLILASAGYGTIAAFLALRFVTQGWPGAGLALTAFGAAYILSRLTFAGAPDKRGGIPVASFCLIVEAAGLLCIALANGPLTASFGAALAGVGYSMVFPSLGVEAVRRAGPENRPMALSAYLACFDLGLGLAGPAMGALASQQNLSNAFLAAAVSAIVSLVLIRVTRR